MHDTIHGPWRGWDVQGLSTPTPHTSRGRTTPRGGACRRSVAVRTRRTALPPPSSRTKESSRSLGHVTILPVSSDPLHSPRSTPVVRCVGVVYHPFQWIIRSVPRSIVLLPPNESGLKPTSSPVEPRFERGSVPPPLRDLDRAARRIDGRKEISMGGLDRAPEEDCNTCRRASRLSQRQARQRHQHTQRIHNTMREVKLVLDWYVQRERKARDASTKKEGAAAHDQRFGREGEHMSHTNLRFHLQDAEHQSYRSLHRQRERLFCRRRTGSQVHQPTHLRLQEDAGFLRRARRGDVCDRSSRIRC